MRSRRNNKQPAYKPGTRWMGSIQTHIVRSMYSTILLLPRWWPLCKKFNVHMYYSRQRALLSTRPSHGASASSWAEYILMVVLVLRTLELGRRRLVELPRPVCLQSAAHDAELRNCGHNIRHPRLHPSRHVRNLRGGKRGGGCPVFCE